jgi:hypothetical protein
VRAAGVAGVADEPAHELLPRRPHRRCFRRTPYGKGRQNALRTGIGAAPTSIAFATARDGAANG